MRERRGGVSVKIDLTLFIARFTLFIYYFIKTNSILFSIKQMNKNTFFIFYQIIILINNYISLFIYLFIESHHFSKTLFIYK